MAEVDRQKAAQRTREITQEIKGNFGESTRLLVDFLAGGEEKVEPGGKRLRKARAYVSEDMMRQYLSGNKIASESKLLEIVEAASQRKIAGERCAEFWDEIQKKHADAAAAELFSASMGLPSDPLTARIKAEKKLEIAVGELKSLRLDSYSILVLTGMLLEMEPVVEEDFRKVSFMKVMDALPEEVDMEIIDYLYRGRST